MPDDEENFGDVLEAENEENDSPDNDLTAEEYEQWVKENAPELEEIVEEHKQKKTEDSEDDNKIPERKQMQIRGREGIHAMDVMEKMRTGEGEHRFHQSEVAFLSAILVSLGFLFNKVFFTALFAAFMISVRSHFATPKEYKSRYHKLAANHPMAMILGTLLQTVIFVAAGYKIPRLELSATEIFLQLFLS